MLLIKWIALIICVACFDFNLKIINLGNVFAIVLTFVKVNKSGRFDLKLLLEHFLPQYSPEYSKCNRTIDFYIRKIASVS